MTSHPSDLKVLAITLARGGSQSIPKKNIADVCGRPLIWYTVKEALKSRYISRFIVSTDDEEIKAVSEESGAEVPFLRPPELSTHTATSTVALQHAVNFCEKQEGIRYDFVVELMCTNPMKTSGDIDGAIQMLIETDAASVIGMSRLEDHHPARAKKIVDDRIVDFCVPELSSRRQDLKPNAYVRNGSIYALRRDTLMVNGVRFGSEDSRPYVMPAEKAVNVDSEVDLLLAGLLIQRYRLHE